MKCLKIVRVKLDPGAKEPVRAQEGEENNDLHQRYGHASGLYGVQNQMPA